MKKEKERKKERDIERSINYETNEKYIVTEERSPQVGERENSMSGELIFLDPNEINFRKSQEGEDCFQRRSVISMVKEDINNSRSPRNTRKIQFKGPVSRSPKTINIGESIKDIENDRKMLGIQNRDEYLQEEAVYFDQPMENFIVEGSYIQGSPKTANLNDYLTSNSRDIQYSLNPRDVDEGYDMNRMSPKNNDDDDSNGSLEEKGISSKEQLMKLKRKVNNEAMSVEVDDMTENEKLKTNTKIQNEESEINTNVYSKSTLTNNERNKIKTELMKKKSKEQGGKLTNSTTTVVSLSNDKELEKGKKKVLQKISKLSNILLAKNSEKTDSIKTFDKNTLNSAYSRKTQRLPKKNRNRFWNLALSMLISGNTEDRMISRSMRFDKGGVVDLVMDDNQRKKFKIRKMNRTVKAKTTYNPAYREKAAKVVQSWWREIKSKYNNLFKKIVLIQSAWRGRWLRKYIYDIMYIQFLQQQFCDGVNSYMKKKARRLIFDMLFNKMKIRKNKLIDLLSNYDNKFSLIRCKPYFEKWRKAIKSFKNKTKNVLKKKVEKENRLKLLHKYFHEWYIRSSLDKFMNEAHKSKNAAKRYFATLKIIFAAQKNAKRLALKTTAPKIELYLAKKMRERHLKSVVSKYGNKKRYYYIKNYFNIWIRHALVLKTKENFKDIVTRVLFRNKERFLNKDKIKCFSIWRSHLNVNLFDNHISGINLLQKYTWRKTYKSPLESFKQTIKNNNKNNSLRNAFKLRSKCEASNKKKVGKYFYKWLIKTNLLSGKGNKKMIIFRNLRKYFTNKDKAVLKQYFDKWRSKPEIDKIFKTCKTFCKAIKKYVNYKTHPAMKDFMYNLKQKSLINGKNKAILMLFKKYQNKSKNADLRWAMKKWRDQIKNMDIYYLKCQLIKYICDSNDIKNGKLMLYKYFNRLRMINSNLKNHKDFYNKRKILEMLNIIEKKYIGKQVKFWTKLHLKAGKDLRPTILRQIIKKIDKPKTSLSEAFNIWLNKVKDINMNERQKKFNQKLLSKTILKIINNHERDAKIKTFFKWKILSLNPQDYYPKLNKAFNIFKTGLTKKYLKQPFNNISKTKNYQKFSKVLRSANKRRIMTDKDTLKECFNKWRNKNISSKLIQNSKKLLIMSKYVNRIISNNKNKLLSAFLKWKNPKSQGVNPNYMNGVKYLRNFCRRPFTVPVCKAFNKKALNNEKKGKLKNILSILNRSKINTLRYWFTKWNMNTKLIDPHRKDKIKSKLRRIIKAKHGKPLEKAFYKWLIKSMKRPDTLKIINGTDILKSGLKKIACKKPFKLIKRHISDEYILNLLRKKMIDNLSKGLNRNKKYYLNKWKNNVNGLKLKELKANLLAKVYCSTKLNLKNRLSRKYFLKWANLEKPKPIDLILARQALNDIEKTLANHYFKDMLFPKLKAKGKINTLKKLISGAPKYYNRIIRHYLNKWRLINEKKTTKHTKNVLTAKLSAQGKKYRTKAKILNAMRKKFQHWRILTNTLKNQLYKNIPVALYNIYKNNIHKNAPGMMEILKLMQKDSIAKEKNKRLRSAHKQRENKEKQTMKNYFDQWKKVAIKLIFLEMNNKMKYSHLRNMIIGINNRLKKYFLKWRIKAGVKRSTTPIEMAFKNIRKVYIRKPFENFVKNMEYYNLKVPRELSVERALLKGERTLAKCVSLRNVFIRPYWSKIIDRVKLIKDRDHRISTFKKLFTVFINTYEKNNKLKGFNNIKERALKSKHYNDMKKEKAKMLYNKYQKALNNIKQRYLTKWLISSDKFKLKALKLKDGLNKLQNYSNRLVTKQMKNALKNQSKMDKASSILKSHIKNTDRKIKQNCLNKWRNKTKQAEISEIKARLIKNIISHMKIKDDMYYQNKFKECFLQWRLRTLPEEQRKKLIKMRHGLDHLQKALHSRFYNNIIDKTNNYGKLRSRHNLLKKLIPNIDDKSKYLDKQRSFKIWIDKVPDTQRMKDKLKKMVEDYINSESGHINLIHKPQQDIIETMKLRHKTKCEKAPKISEFFRGIQKIHTQLLKIRRNELFKNIILRALNKDINTKHVYMNKWKNITNKIVSNDKATIIQKFLRERLHNPENKRNKVIRFSELYNKMLKRYAFKNINNYGKNKYILLILQKLWKNKQKSNKDILRNKYHQWIENAKKVKEDQMATKIQNKYRSLRSKKKRDKLSYFKTFLKQGYNHIKDLHKNAKKQVIEKWRRINLILKANEKAEIIRNFLRNKLEKLSKERIKKMGIYIKIKDLCDVLKKTSRICGDKGDVMNKTLKEILNKRFNKLINGMRLVGRVKQLNKTIPIVNNRLRAYYLPKALNKWKKNTWDDLINKTILIQRATKKFLYILHRNRDLKRKQFLKMLVLKKEKATTLRQMGPFTKWLKNAKLCQFEDKVKKIQNTFRSSKAKDKSNKLRSKQHLKNMFTKTMLHKISDALKETNEYTTYLYKTLNFEFESKIEQRVAGNDLIGYANDALRKWWIRVIYNNKFKMDKNSTLKKYLNKWRTVVYESNKAATKINNACRTHLANKKLRNIKKQKNILKKYVLIKDLSTKDTKSSILHTWLQKSKALAVIYHAEVIERFLKQKMIKVMTERFQKFFKTKAKKLVHKKLNQISKINKLKKSLQKYGLKTIMQKLSALDKMNKFKSFLIKFLPAYDNKLRNNKLKESFEDWNINAKKVNRLRSSKAKVIQRNYRDHVKNKKEQLEKKKQNLLLKILVKLLNDTTFKKQAAYILWKNKTNLINITENANIIQDFVDDINNKAQKRFKAIKSLAYKKIAKILCNSKSFLKEPLNKIKSKSNKVILENWITLLLNKEKDNKKYVMRSLKNKYKNNLLNNLIKIKKNINERVLSDTINKWNDNANALLKDESQKIIRTCYNNYLKKNRSKILKILMIKLVGRKENILNTYFNKWKNNVMQIKIKKASLKINHFIYNKYKTYKAGQKWNKISKKLENLNGKKEREQLFKRIREYLACMKLSEAEKEFNRKNLLAGIYTFKAYYINQIFRDAIIKRDNHSLKLHSFNKWNKKAQKLKERDQKFVNSMKLVDKREKIMALQCFNDASLINKFRNAFIKARKNDLINRLNKNCEIKKKSEKLGNTLRSTKRSLKDENKRILAEKLMKIFTYKKVDKLYDIINKHLINVSKREAEKDLFAKLMDNLLKQSYFDNDQKKEHSYKSATTKLSFHRTIINPKKLHIKQDKNSTIKKIVPNFVQYLDNKLKAKKKDAMNTLILNDRDARFCELLKKFNNKKQQPQKKDLVEKLKEKSEYMDSRGTYILKIYELFKRRWVKYCADSLQEPAKIHKLFYLIRLTQMHQKISKQRYIREISRKWRFAAFVKKMARKKLDLMYRNLQVSYMQMAEEVFGEDSSDNNLSVMKEFEMFGSSMNMFNPSESDNNFMPHNVFLSDIKKKYVFKNISNNIIKKSESKKKVFEKEEEIMDNDDNINDNDNNNNNEE